MVLRAKPLLLVSVVLAVVCFIVAGLSGQQMPADVARFGRPAWWFALYFGASGFLLVSALALWCLLSKTARYPLWALLFSLASWLAFTSFLTLVLVVGISEASSARGEVLGLLIIMGVSIAMALVSFAVMELTQVRNKRIS